MAAMVELHMKPGVLMGSPPYLMKITSSGVTSHQLAGFSANLLFGPFFSKHLPSWKYE
jgi:hypothetical protein